MVVQRDDFEALLAIAQLAKEVVVYKQHEMAGLIPAIDDLGLLLKHIGINGSIDGWRRVYPMPPVAEADFLAALSQITPETEDARHTGISDESVPGIQLRDSRSGP